MTFSGSPAWDEFFRERFGPADPIIAAIIALPDTEATETREPRLPSVWYTREGPHNGQRFRIIGTKTRADGAWVYVFTLQPV